MSTEILTFEQLEHALKHHDWYYGYSDDHRVWEAGTANWKRIVAGIVILRDDNLNKTVDLYKYYCPWGSESTLEEIENWVRTC
jgi:hypothetical protein